MEEYYVYVVLASGRKSRAHEAATLMWHTVYDSYRN